MKKVVFFVISLMLSFPLFAQDSVVAQKDASQVDSARYIVEPSVFVGSGFMMDHSGSGGYTYGCFGLMLRKNDFRLGIFTNTTKVYVKFNGYSFKATEFTVGPSLDGWGRLDSSFSYSFWAQPGFKFFKDYGHNAGFENEAWQNDRGFYGVFGANINDDKNRWFRSYKINIMYQKPFWSKRVGTWPGSGSGKINYKATNKTFFKVQLESTGRKLRLQKGRLEPKLVLGYLYDGGSKKDLFEYGAGLAFSFTKSDRYFEVFNLQYRLRYGTDFGQPFHVFEIGCDFISLFKLLKS
ncbi:MAG: hypothetical protein NTX66_01355 [Candidatus Falkowbacteria bacterium]|nr:hypothetical protein [Candidatus Falkowbacteria bacterium]